MAAMRVTVVGCAGSFPGPDSPASCYLLEAEGFRLVLDLGNGALGVLQRFAGLFSIDAICLSHLHADHCVDLGAYWVARQYTSDGPRPPIPVHGPLGTAERVAGFGGEGTAAVQARFAFRDLQRRHDRDRAVPGHRRSREPPGGDVRLPGGARGLAAGLLGRHGGVRRAGPAGRGGRSAAVRGVVPRRAATYRPNLHLTARQAAEHAARAGVGQLVLTHLVPWNDRDRTLAEASQAYRGPLSLATSGLVLGPGVPGPDPAPHPPPADRLCVMSRPDGRSVTELRPVKLTRGWLDHAEGSVLVEFGRTRVLCAASVTEDVPRWRRGSGLGWVTAEYAMLPRATNTRGDRESVKGRLGGRTQEISRLVGRSLRACVDYKALGENTIVIDCDVLQADGGTRTAAVTGGYVALADAVAWLKGRKRTKGDPLLTSVSAVSVGIVDGEPRLDLCYEEDVAAQTDMNVVCTASGDFVEIQGTAEQEPFSRDLLGQLLDLAVAGCGELTRLQREALGG